LKGFEIDHVLHSEDLERRVALGEREAPKTFARPLGLEYLLGDHKSKGPTLFQIAVGTGIGKKHGEVLLTCTQARLMPLQREEPIAVPKGEGPLAVFVRKISPANPRWIPHDKVKLTHVNRSKGVLDVLRPDPILSLVVQLFDYPIDLHQPFLLLGEKRQLL